MTRIAQVNLNDSGGAFALMYHVQKELQGKVVFDYYTIHAFSDTETVRSIRSMNGNITEDLAGSRLSAHLKLPFMFYKRMKKSPYEVVHIHSDTAWKLSVYAIPARLAGIRKIIVHSHSSGINGDHQKLKYVCHCLMKPVLPYFADELVTCSKAATKWMFPKKYHSQVRFIKNGVQTEIFRFSKENRKKYREELGVKDQEILLGTVGDLSFQKNPHYLIEVFCALYSRNPQYKLIFIGDGEEARLVREWAKEKRGYENLIFYGKTSHVGGLLSAMDFYLMPSRFEGFPVSAVEAQINGLPCILSDSITKEVRMSDHCVFWSIEEKPDEWAERLYQWKAGLHEEIRKKGYQAAWEQGFDISRTAERILQLYKE